MLTSNAIPQMLTSSNKANFSIIAISHNNNIPTHSFHISIINPNPFYTQWPNPSMRTSQPHQYHSYRPTSSTTSCKYSPPCNLLYTCSICTTSRKSCNTKTISSWLFWCSYCMCSINWGAWLLPIEWSPKRNNSGGLLTGKTLFNKGYPCKSTESTPIPWKSLS